MHKGVYFLTIYKNNKRNAKFSFLGVEIEIMENEQIQEYCQEALKISEVSGIHDALSFLLGEKFGINFVQLKKARRKLQFLYPNQEIPENHPLNQGGRSLKMSYAMTVQEHYSTPLEQVKHLEIFMGDFVKAVKNTFSEEDIRRYLDSSPQLGPREQDLPDQEIEYFDVLQEANEILAIEDIKKLLL